MNTKSDAIALQKIKNKFEYTPSSLNFPKMMKLLKRSLNQRGYIQRRGASIIQYESTNYNILEYSPGDL